MKPIVSTFFTVLLCVTLGGCASDKGAKPISLEPTLVSQSYDYTSPQNIANQDQPVWVLPVKNSGWQKGGVDGSGAWYSGGYHSYIVKPGYWSSQEEAQLSGRPFLVNNQTVIPSPGPDGAPSTNPGAMELDVTKTNSRLDAIEKNQQQLQGATGNPDADAANAARTQALATLASHQVTTQVDTDPDVTDLTPKPRMTVPVASTSTHKKVKTTSTTSTASTMPDGARKATIHYDTSTTGSVIMDGRSYPFVLQHPGDTVTLTIPQTKP